MNMKDNVYDALKILIKISKNAQETFREGFNYVGDYQWIKELCTIRASTARGGGHTTAILKLMEDGEMNIGCVFQNNDLKQIFHEAYNYREPSRGNLDFSCSSHNFEQKMMGRNLSHLDAIVFDNTFMMSAKMEKEICLSLVPAIFGQSGIRPFYFIFLQ